VGRRLRLERLEDRTLPSTFVGPLPLPADVTVVPWNGHQDFVVAGQWIARFAGTTGPVASQTQAIQALLDKTSLKLSVVRQLGLDGQVLLQGPTNETPDQVLTLNRLPGLLYVEPNFFNFDPLDDTYPNNPFFNLEYGLHNTGQVIQGQAGTPGADISAPQAWDISTGSTSLTIADIDTGADYNHPDLYKNIWINQAEIPASRMQNLVDVDGDGKITFRDLNDPINQGPFKIMPGPDGRVTPAQILAPMIRDGQGQDTGMGGWAYMGNTQDGDTDHPNDFVGWNFAVSGGGNNTPFDGNSHGTHTAGTIAAEGNSGIGVSGVNWVAQLMPVKWINDGGSGSDADAVAAVNYSWRHGASVSSNSWHVNGDDPALRDAIAGARDAGDLYVCSAGNNSFDTDTHPYYPETYIHTLDNMISVAALDNRDHIASFSDWGLQTVSLGGPGDNVYSTFPNNSYGYDSGTSMSTPHVAGAAILAWSIAPGATYHDIRQAILDTVDPVSDLRVDGPHPVASGGRLNLFHLLQDFHAAGPVVRSSTPSHGIFPAVSSIRFTFDVPIDVSTFTTDQIDSFTGPNGDIPVADVQVVPGSDNMQFDVLFATQTAVGQYSMTIGPNILDEQGNPMDQNRNGIPGEIPGDEYTARFNLQGPEVTSSTPTGGNFAPGTVDHVRVTFNEPMDPATFTIDGATLVDPQGNYFPRINAVQPVSGTNNTQFDVMFDPLTQSGTYTVVIGPYIADPYGNLMDQNGNGIPGEYPDDQFISTITVQAPHVLNYVPSGSVSGPLDHARVTFDLPMDIATFTPAQVTLTGPGGPVTVNNVVEVDGSNYTRFDIQFDPLPTGSYRLTLDNTIADLYGNPVVDIPVPTELVSNGGFETGAFAPWVQSGDTGATGIVTSPVHSGTHAAEFGPVGGLGYITQMLATTPGVGYTLSFWLSHPYTSTGTEWLVRVGGTTLNDVHDAANFNYTEFRYTFTATSSSTPLQFGFWEPPAYFYLDDVSAKSNASGLTDQFTVV
jgi:subtilisin family serine protease